MLSKSDFLHYVECPRHFWAYKREVAKSELAPLAKFLADQGKIAENLITAYLRDKFVFDSADPVTYDSQPTFTDGEYMARADVAITKNGFTSLYEIKSSTRVRSEHLYDATFQMLVAEASVKIDKVFLVHLNPDYVYDGHYDREQLIMIEDVTEQCRSLAPEVKTMREQALFAMSQANPHHLSHCYQPKTCPCPDLCHPDLPEHSIYELAGASHKQLDTLLELGIRRMADIPTDFPLSEIQQKQVQSLQTNQPVIDHQAMTESLEKLQYPLYFLDYETCNAALPMYLGYHPQQPMVFQYSLHVMSVDGSITHAEYLATEPGEPARKLVADLKRHISAQGSVIVWNKTFEASRNKEMAALFPDQSKFLLGLNERMYDLADIVRYGAYVDHRFGGSWSIKNVLPVIIPELSYKDLEISKGDQAMLTWWELVRGNQTWTESEKERIIDAMQRYCERDTEAMVEIWKRLNTIIN